jgi:hypothetical protein
MLIGLGVPLTLSYFSRRWWSCLRQMGKERLSRRRPSCLFRYYIHDRKWCITYFSYLLTHIYIYIHIFIDLFKTIFKAYHPVVINVLSYILQIMMIIIIIKLVRSNDGHRTDVHIGNFIYMVGRCKQEANYL